MDTKQTPRRFTAIYPLSLALFVSVVGGAAIINNNHAIGDELRIYRIAIAATGEFTQHHGGTKADALAAIKDIVSELNKIYEPELAIRLQLVSDADQNKIIYTNGATDPYTPGDRTAQRDQNQITLDAEIGSANYDIGHVIGKVPTNGGGIAGVGVVGRDGRKAEGISETQKPSASDLGFIGVLAHEIGHQFGAEHTFNADALGSCLTNRSATNAYEPASGSTIMSYAGICGADNLQLQEDLYFHAASLEQINDYIENNAHASPYQTAMTGNAIPAVGGGADFVIPANTPFELTAAGADSDGDPLTYVWEQLDLGPSMSLPLTDNGSSPLFRSFPPTPNPTRTFPRLSDLLANTTSPGEVLPTTDRNLNFRVTVRDNRAGGGGVHSDGVHLEVRNTGAPFMLTSPNGGDTFTGGSNHTVTWNVAGTTGNGINTSQVNIFLSTNGGQSFPFLLATTANDGSESITLPNIDTTQARLKIQGSGNVFFDFSNNDFSIIPNPAMAGVTVTQSNGNTTATEDGVIDSYQLSLKTSPGGTATITASSGPETQLSTDGAVFSSSVALTLNSTAGKTIFVRAIDDNVMEGGHTGIISHAITSSSSGSYPMNTVINQVEVHIVDNEAPPVVGVDLDFSDTHPSPTNWKTLLLDSNSKNLSNLMRDDGIPTSIDLTLQYDSGAGSFGWNEARISNSTKPQHRPVLDQINGFNSGTKPLTATWSDLIPGRTYGVYVFGLDGSATDNFSQTVTISGATSLPEFTQNLVNDEIYVNAMTGSEAQPLTFYERSVAANANGEISVRIVPTGPDGLGLAGLAIREILPTTPGITITQATVTEGGSSSTYNVNLNSDPAGTVSIALDADADTEISLDGTNFATTQIVSVNNTAQQTITVRAIDDTAVEGEHISTITHTILSSNSTQYPITLTLDPAAVLVLDNDGFGPLAGLDFDNGDGTTPTNWRQMNFFSSSATNLKWEDGSDSNIDLTITRNTGNYSQGLIVPTAETVPMHSPSLDGLDFVFLHPASEGTISLIWKDLNPSTPYNLYVFALEGFGGDVVIDQTVTITGQGEAVAFTQATTVNDELWVNGQKGSNDGPVESFAVPMTSTSGGEINMSITANNGVSWICLAGFAIQEAPILHGVTVDAGDGVTLMEGGATDTYTIALDSMPGGPVEMTVTADAQSEVSLDGANFASSRTFTRTDTSAQTITVRAVDDSIVEEPHTSRISHTITSTGDATNYPMSTVIDKVTAVIEDNDVAMIANVSITASDANGAEPSDDAQFTVSLSPGQFAPTGGVTVNYTIEGTATTGSDYASLGTSVVIAAGTNSSVIDIDVIDDDVSELPESVIITLTSSDVAGIEIAAAPDNTATAILTSNEQTSYQAFLSAFFDASILTDPAKEATHWGFDADIDEDALNTLQEFFHNLSPTLADDSPISSSVVTDAGTKFLDIVFQRRKDHQGVQQIIEEGASPAAASWQTSAAFTESVTSIDAETEAVRIRYDITSLTRRFLRLKLMQN